MVIFMVWRASGGRKERKRRAVLALGEKGLKTVVTSVRKREIIVWEYYGGVSLVYERIWRAGKKIFP